MTDKNDGASRRDFLKLAGTMTPAVAVAMAGGKAAEAATDTPDPYETRLRDTDHTRAYFASARL